MLSAPVLAIPMRRLVGGEGFGSGGVAARGPRTPAAAAAVFAVVVVVVVVVVGKMTASCLRSSSCLREPSRLRERDGLAFVRREMAGCEARRRSGCLAGSMLLFSNAVADVEARA